MHLYVVAPNDSSTRFIPFFFHEKIRQRVNNYKLPLQLPVNITNNT